MFLLPTLKVQAMKKFHICDRSCIESVSEYEPETSGASTSNYNANVELYASRNLLNNPSTTSIYGRFKNADDAAMPYYVIIYQNLERRS